MKNVMFVCLLATALCFAQNGPTQKIDLEGTVKDPSGEPIAKAILFVDSVKTFVRTNKKGKFRTQVPENTRSLAIYAKDHGLYHQMYDGATTVNFEFNASVDHLTERDLAGLGFTMVAPKKGTIDPARFKEYPDIFQLIREMFTGVVVNGSTIIVRGKGSFGNDTPLFLVDDNFVPDISFINPVEVQSIELLKGEDTALYGARGANGVFIINLIK